MKKIWLMVLIILALGVVIFYAVVGRGQAIKIISPLEDGAITSPLVVSGEARGNWFFEAVIPFVLTDWDGKIIAEGYATAKSDWMTEDFVPFEGTLTFTKPEFGDRGFLIIQKANPSGDPQYDEAKEIPILFK